MGGERSGLWLAGFLYFDLLCCPRADAQAIDHSVRLGVDLPLFDYESTTIKGSASSGFDVTTTNTGYGLVPSKLGLNLGTGLAETAAMGFRVALAGGTLHVNDNSSQSQASKQSEFDLQLLPYVEYVAQPGFAVRPYVGVTGGVSINHTSTPDSSKLDLVGGIIGAMLGLHCFVGHEVSLDPEFFVLYRAGSAEVTGGSGLSFSGFTVALALGLSGWVGARASPLPEARPVQGEQDTYVGPRTASRPRSTNDERALLVGRSMLDGLELFWLGMPRARPDEVALRFQHYAPQPTLSNCHELELTIDGQVKRYPLKQRVSERSGVVLETVQADIEVDTLRVMNSAKTVVFNLCGVERRLNGAAALEQDSFLKRFDALAPARTSAPEHGGEPEPPNAPEPPPASSGPTSAPAQPEAPQAPPESAPASGQP